MTHEEAKASRKQWLLDIDAESERHSKAVRELDRKATELKKSCPHEEVSSYSGCGDDCGGYTCESCGKDLGFYKPEKSKQV
jgi:hypothetical protein